MKQNKNYPSAIIISVALHLALVAALLWGTDFNMSKPTPSGGLVQAVVIDPNVVKRQASEIRTKRNAAAKAEKERLDKLRKQSAQLEKNRKAEEDRIRKLQEDKAKADIAARESEKQRKKEQEKVRVEKALAAKAEAERKEKQQAVKKAEQERIAKRKAVEKAEQERIVKQKAVDKAEKERLAKEEAVKQAQEKARVEKERAAKAEADRIAKEKAAAIVAEKVRKEKARLKQLERERKEQESALGDIFAGLEQESSQNLSAKQRFVASEVDRYGAIYRQLIENNLLMEESYRGKSCKLNLRLLPTGKNAILSDVKVLGGDTRVCAATKRAVAQVRSFPLPEDKEIIEQLRNINLTFAPE